MSVEGGFLYCLLRWAGHNMCKESFLSRCRRCVLPQFLCCVHDPRREGMLCWYDKGGGTWLSAWNMVTACQSMIGAQLFVFWKHPSHDSLIWLFLRACHAVLFQCCCVDDLHHITYMSYLFTPLMEGYLLKCYHPLGCCCLIVPWLIDCKHSEHAHGHVPD
jgi:hypothetical protein